MSGTVRRRTLVTLWALSVCAALGTARPAEAGSSIREYDLHFDLSALSRESRASLRKIDVLLLTDDNLEVVWRLAKRPRRADVIVVACSPRCLSSDVLEALADWAKGGRGLFLEASAAFMASPFLLPDGHLLEPLMRDLATGHSWLERGSPLNANVAQIGHELWCSRDGRGTLRPRSRDPESGVDLETALLDSGEIFMPVISWSPERPEHPFAAPEVREPVLLASTYGGARVVWYAQDFDLRDDCAPRFDDVRLWSNLIHWLAGKEPPDHSAASSSAR